jgi:hypothetical protein
MTMSDSYNIILNQQSRWGALYTPLKPKAEKKGGLRIVLFISCNSGNLLFENLVHFESLYPEKLNIVGVVTDDPVDPAARISIKKRIWNQFSPEEREVLFQRTVDSAIGIGVPCYSGAVKTDYFREIFYEWKPEALLMFCYGQIIDIAIYGYPFMGSYNFHPSDLQNKIGGGSQPFQNTILNGSKTSVLVIHKVTDIVDVGPIVSISPLTNICLNDGGYPSSILSLDDKITCVGGWMGVALTNAIISKKESGKTGHVDNVDVGGVMPDTIKTILRQPVVNDLKVKYEVPLHPLLNK